MKNPVTINGDTAILHLLRGQESLVDTADLELIDQHHGWWIAHQQPKRRLPYVIGMTKRDGRPFTLRLHRFIMDPPKK
jgi:hypothetical protein